jgi:hypothetical protein
MSPCSKGIPVSLLEMNTCFPVYLLAVDEILPPVSMIE